MSDRTKTPREATRPVTPTGAGRRRMALPEPYQVPAAKAPGHAPAGRGVMGETTSTFAERPVAANGK